MDEKEDIQVSDLFFLYAAINALEPSEKELTINFIKEIKKRR